MNTAVDVSPLASARNIAITAGIIGCWLGFMLMTGGIKEAPPDGLTRFASLAMRDATHGAVIAVLSLGILLRIRLAGLLLLGYLVFLPTFFLQYLLADWARLLGFAAFAGVMSWGAASAINFRSYRADAGGNLFSTSIRRLTANMRKYRLPRSPAEAFHVFGFLALSAGGLWMIATHVMPAAMDDNSLSRTAQGLWLVWLLGLTIWSFDHARRHALRSTSELLAVDRRRPVLFLRSFADENLGVLAPWYDIRGWPAKKRWHSMRFEPALQVLLAHHGPLVAIGQPGEALPELGAAREYALGDEWRDRVEQLIADAQLIVVIAGASQGLTWELERVARLGATSKLMIVLPPCRSPDPEDKDDPEVQSKAAAERWKRFLAAVAHINALTSLQDVDGMRALVARMMPDGSALVVRGNARGRHYYGHAIDVAMRDRAMSVGPSRGSGHVALRRVGWTAAGLAVASASFLAGQNVREEMGALRGAALEQARTIASQASFSELAVGDALGLGGSLSGTVHPGASGWRSLYAPSPTVYAVECRVSRDQDTMTSRAQLFDLPASGQAPFFCQWHGRGYKFRLSVPKPPPTYTSPTPSIAERVFAMAADPQWGEAPQKVEARLTIVIAGDTIHGEWHTPRLVARQ
jgi:hypothetical protein